MFVALHLTVTEKQSNWQTALPGLTSPRFCACPISGPGFSSVYVVLFVFNDLRWSVDVHFVE